MEKLIVPSILSVGEVVSLTDRILKATQGLTLNDPKLKTLHDKVTGIYERLVKNLNNTSKSKLTEELYHLDKQRDSAFISLRDILHGMSLSLNDDMSAKASTLYALIDKHGTQAYKLGYKAETATLLALFTDFDLPENQQKLTDLGILPIYNSLKTAQVSFDTVSKQKADEKAVYTNESEAATTIVQEIFPALTSLVAMLQLNYQLDPATYGETYNQLVTYITEVNTSARARKTRKQNTGEPESEAPKA